MAWSSWRWDFTFNVKQSGIDLATLNPIAILLTFLLWSYLWGVTGTLRTVPLLATFKIFCDRVEPLRRVGSFLGRS